MIKKIALSTLLASTLVVAAEPDLKKDDAFVTHTELGFIETQGNTETKTFNLESTLKKGWERNIFELHFDGQYAQDKEVETKNKYLIELEYDYEITDRLAFDYLLGYKTDKFSAFDSQFYTGPGAKYKVIVSKKHNLSLEGNVLYAIDEISDVNYDAAGDIISYPSSTPVFSTITGETDDYAAFRAKAVYGWQMLENLKFDQELSYRSSLEDTNKYFIFSKSAFKSKLSDIFSAGISYKVDYVNEPGVKEKTDTTLTANLIIDY